MTYAMALDTTAQIVGYAISAIIGLSVLAMTALVKLSYNSIRRVHDRLDHLDVCVDEVKKKVEGVRTEQGDVRRELAQRNQEHGALREQLAHLKGISGIALHEEVAP